ncbi:Rne/Rng family ribonuclease [Roseomonas sp. OT10]|uniref:Rne/Rng family ribonuclease n=1 Tax=Roseomonas cutis TaxID=2897332 RepID=UPI001E52E1C0|nr:ribonuclease E/G [Roseomonas sp. OT10]UFN47828.1 Rne/Rng family ribonuclease [Roseomonas sp. OT10]
MTKRMLIDASHPEETRLVVMDGNRIEDYDVEAADRLPLKGNIYLAKVVRVEPSLQAAFVEYGGNRHGFLAFGEIHPDYYQIPVADRQRLLEMQAQEAEEDEEREELETAAERVAPEDDRDLQAQEGREGGRGRDRQREGRGRGRDGGRDGGRDRRDRESRAAGEAREESHPEERRPVAAGEEGGDPAAEPTAPADAPAAQEPAAFDSLTGTGLAEVPPGEAAGPETAPGDEGAGDGQGTEPGSSETGGPAPRSQAMAMYRDEVAEGEPTPGPAAAGGVFDAAEPAREAEAAAEAVEGREVGEAEEPPPEVLGGDSGNGAEEGAEEGEDRGRERRIPPRFLRHYKIQEVIRRRQIMLVQVVKEERGNKGAALTTYISLAGRFSVLMPNSPRGGGVSRKITQVADRKRLREAVEEMHLPKGMSIIVRTAGAQRPKPEIKRDGEYLLRLWDEIRERTLASTAPALVYEEADLIKRSIRDTYGRDIDDIEVEGEAAWKQARDFMRLIMPQHEKRVRLYRDPAVPLFARAGAEQQLDAMMSPVVQLKSGGYIVINQTEALVAIDVNSGRATRDRHIEDTALRTNCEAAEEIARQVRLRDLAGLIVIDFIDMESSKHDAQVERKLKDALRHDRARIQVGRISHFGLLEMSRQRLRPSLTEHSFVTCPHCQGRGIVRSLESSALHVLRAIEEEGAKRRASEIVVHAAEPVAMHILNRKRERLAAIEARHAMAVLLAPDAELSEANLRIERMRAQTAPPPSLNRAPALRMDYAPEPLPAHEEEPEEIAAEAVAEPEAGEVPAAEEARGGEDGRGENRRRRRRRRGRREGNGTAEGAGPGGAEEADEEEGDSPEAEAGEAPEGGPEGSEEDAAGEGEAPPRDAAPREGRDEEGRGRRRNRRGRRRPEEEGAAPAAEVARYAGPTPADPFAGTYDDVFDAMAAAEAAAEAAARRIAGGDGAVEAVARVHLEPDAPPVVTVVASVAPAEAAAPPPPEAPAADAPEAGAPAASAEAVAAAPAEAEPAPAEAASAEVLPEPEALPEPATPATPEAAPAGPAEPVVGAPVQPVVLGSGQEADAPRRQGWWRR